MTTEEERRIGPYVLRRSLGRGGFGQVYIVHKDNPTDRPLVGAMKLLHSHMIGIRSVIERVLREARLGMSLGSHPNIVMITDVGLEGSTPYLVMEYLDCVDLGHLMRGLIQRRRPLPMQAVSHILASMAAGLYHAHSGATTDNIPVRIVHRDITPHNILITRDGAVKIADFGLGVSLLEGTSGGHIRGTFRYMSPEHLDGKISPEMDVYSFGVVAWELVEGRVIREGVEREAHYPHIMNGNIPEMRNGNAQLTELIRSCLDVNPRGRPSAAELCDILPRCEWYSRDPTILVQDITDIIGNRRSSGASQEHFRAPTELIATLAAIRHEKRNERGVPWRMTEGGESTENATPSDLAAEGSVRDPDAPMVYRKREGSPGEEEEGPIREVSFHIHPQAEKPLPTMAGLVERWKPLEERTTQDLESRSAEITTQEFARPPISTTHSDRSPL